MEEELAFVCFRDVAWLQAFPLTAENVLEYFSLSQFYDRTCNNEVLKMQASFTENTTLLSRLHTMTGTEYAVARAQPPKLFVIAKQERRSPQTAIVSDYYYIFDGSVFMAPTLHATLHMRLISSMHHLGQALDYAKQHVSFNVNSYQYTVDDTGSEPQQERLPSSLAVQAGLDFTIRQALQDAARGDASV